LHFGNNEGALSAMAATKGGCGMMGFAEGATFE
jgi:hypothetical protein